MGYAAHYILLSPHVPAQITRFNLFAASHLIFYRSFKDDLLQFLGGTINLLQLPLYHGPTDNTGLIKPLEGLIRVRSIRLPHLVTFNLQLQATIFTDKELGLLGLEAG